MNAIRLTDLTDFEVKDGKVVRRQVRSPKYRNRKTVVDGITFDSAKEARRWGELQLLQRAGKIRDLQRQVRIPLQVNGIVIAVWLADFTYTDNENDQVTWEDVKSSVTRKLPVYRLKAKLIRAIYGREILET